MSKRYLILLFLVFSSTILVGQNNNNIEYQKKIEMENKALINQFYTAFVAGNAEQMANCYHDEIVFEDPAFGQLKGERAIAMWRMLLSNNEANLKVKYSYVEANEKTGSAQWIANYNYGPQKRAVENHVKASFEFKDGKIIKHTDVFDLWKWTRQALGVSGYVLGWSPFMRNKIQEKTNALLDKFMAKNN